MIGLGDLYFFSILHVPIIDKNSCYDTAQLFVSTLDNSALIISIYLNCASVSSCSVNDYSNCQLKFLTAFFLQSTHI